MAYHYSRKVSLPFDLVLSKIQDNLQLQGFRVITCIDVQETLKQNLNIDFRKYSILGAFHAELAYKAISLESHIGLIFPCHIVVQEHENGEVEISAVSPLETVEKNVETGQLIDLARAVDNYLRTAVDDLQRLLHVSGHPEALPTEGIQGGAPVIQG